MYTPKEFERAVKNSEGLICYGVGKRFHMFLRQYQNSDVIKRLLYCIDANKKLQGKEIMVGERPIPVYPVAKLNEIRNRKVILLITNYYYEQVVDDLERLSYLEGVQYYCYTHLHGMILEENALHKKIPADIRITSRPVIPKKIHYCWFGGGPVPDKYQKWMESWKKFCPDYEIIRWDESNYDVRKNAYMYEAYQCEKWGFVPDYARLDIIYEHGGIYLDTDVELVANLDDLLYQKAWFGFEREESVALGLGFGAIKKMPLIGEMMEFYANRHFINEAGQPDLTASPIYQTDFLVKKGLKLNGEYQRIGDAVIYPEKMFSGKCPYTRRVRLTSYTKSIHHYEATWADDEFKGRNERFEREMNS